MKEYKTIFNHTLAPVGPGPSSSNTCGPLRIGFVSRQLLGGTPASFSVEYDKNGTFSRHLFGMKSDISFISGLLGNKPEDAPDITNAYEEAKAQGMKIAFKETDDLKSYGAKTVRIRMTARDGNTMAVIGESLGGGSFVIHMIDDCSVDIRGDHYELLIFLNEKDEDAVKMFLGRAAEWAKQINYSQYAIGKNHAIAELKLPREAESSLLDRIRAEKNVLFVRTIMPVHPVVKDITRVPPFETPEGMAEYCKRYGCTPAKAAIDYETAVSGWSEDEVRKYGYMLIDTMKASRAGGFSETLSFEGILSPKALTLKNDMPKSEFNIGVLDEAIPSALSIMEFSNAAGKIVCVPTGGSSGIVPGLLISASEHMHKSKEELYQALMCAGLIGILMMVDGNEFCGGAHGCQSEVACGTAMAAAGMVQMMNGTAEQACDAASMSLQCFLGLICDPVGGFVQVPCLARNIAGVAVAAAASKAVCAGFDVAIHLQEMSRIMVKTGYEIENFMGPSCGCCTSELGRRLAEENKARSKKNR